MSDPKRPELPGQAPAQNSCALCGEAVVPAEARSVEVQDYMLYFCGPDCYQQWRDQRQHDDDQD